MLNMGGSCSEKIKEIWSNPVKEFIFLSVYRGIFKTLKTWSEVKVYFNRYFHSNGQREKGSGSAAMKRQKLNYRFHNPNTAEVTADYILKLFIEVNAKKVDRIMQEVAERNKEENKHEEK